MQGSEETSAALEQRITGLLLELALTRALAVTVGVIWLLWMLSRTDPS